MSPLRRFTIKLSAAAAAASFGLAILAGGVRAQPAPKTCARGPQSIGLSRVVEVDSSDGPQFGQQQYKFIDFLEPGEVVLTFDDGPLRPYTSAVLKALETHCTKATFFNVGKMALADPEMVREIERRGHTLGSHTWSHRNLRAMAPALAKGEVELGFSAVSKAAGHPISPFFRFPYLSDSRAMIAHMKSRQIGMFSIDVDAVDYRTRDPQVVHNRVLAGLREHGKGIILFHDIQPSTAGALKGLLDALNAKGFKVVHFVPKSTVKTLPEYDAIAEQQFNARRQIAAGNPMAERSIVWPNTAASAVPDEALAGSGRAAPPRRTATAAAMQPQALPPPAMRPAAKPAQGTVAAVAPNDAFIPPAAQPAASAPAPRPRPTYVDEDDWRWKLFNGNN